MPYLKDRYLRTVTQMVEKIRAQVFVPVSPLTMTCYATTEPVDFAHRTEGREMHLHEGDSWGENVFDCGWFHFEGAVPQECQGFRASPVWTPSMIFRWESRASGSILSRMRAWPAVKSTCGWMGRRTICSA